MPHYTWRAAVALGTFLLVAGCGKSIEQNIQTVMARGEGREEALLELLFAKTEALPVLIRVMEDTTLSGRGRADVVEVVWRIFIRESDSRITPALTGRIADPAPEVRQAAAMVLADMGKKEAIGPLFEQLEVEVNQDVQLQLLIGVHLALEKGVNHGQTLNQIPKDFS